MSDDFHKIIDAGITLYGAIADAGMNHNGPLVVRLEPQSFFRLESLMGREPILMRNLDSKADGHLRMLTIGPIRYETVLKKRKTLPDGSCIPCA